MCTAEKSRAFQLVSVHSVLERSPRRDEVRQKKQLSYCKILIRRLSQKPRERRCHDSIVDSIVTISDCMYLIMAYK